MGLVVPELANEVLIEIAREQIANNVREVFTTKQAADYLSLSPARLEIWRHEGGGPDYVKLARSVRYRKEDIDAWLASNRRSNTSQQDPDSKNSIKGVT